jgi:tRNA threonylcarbamoyladenosine biosynthesis protein TsaE
VGPVTEAAPHRVERSTRSPGETRRLGERLGKLLAPGDVVALSGELGAGKTQLARGICRGAGVPDEEISSPTFAIVATYRGRLPVNHADLYRIGDGDELHATGFRDLVGGDGASVVEWADRFPGALPAGRLEIRLLEVAGHPSARRLLIAGHGERHARLARALAPRRRA